VMSLLDASVDDGVPHGFVGVVDAHLGSETPLLTLVGPGRHFVKPLQAVLDGLLASVRGDTVHPSASHLHPRQKQSTDTQPKEHEYESMMPCARWSG
jgi:hypothetical protein